MDLGIFGDQKKCPKWKTCLCHRGSNSHCRISINSFGNYNTLIKEEEVFV